jgi:hypothetical protein
VPIPSHPHTPDLRRLADTLRLASQQARALIELGDDLPVRHAPGEDLGEAATRRELAELLSVARWQSATAAELIEALAPMSGR